MGFLVDRVALGLVFPSPLSTNVTDGPSSTKIWFYPVMVSILFYNTIISLGSLQGLNSAVSFLPLTEGISVLLSYYSGLTVSED